MRNIFAKDPNERDKEKLLALLKKDRKEKVTRRPSSQPIMSTFSKAEIMDNEETIEHDDEELPMDPRALRGMSLKDYNRFYAGEDYGDALPMPREVLRKLKLDNLFNKYINRVDSIKKSIDEFDPEAVERLNKRAKRIKLLIISAAFAISTVYAADKLVFDKIDDRANEPKGDDSFIEITVGEEATDNVINAIVSKYNVDKNEIVIDNGIAKVPKPKKGKRIY